MNKSILLSCVLLVSLLMSGCGSLPGRGRNTESSNDTAIAPLEAMPVLPIPGINSYVSYGAEADPSSQVPEIPEALNEEGRLEGTQNGETDSDVLSQTDKLYRVTGSGILWLSITEEVFLDYAEFLKREWGLNNAAVCGMLANIQEESGFDPTLVGDGGAAFGICQWRAERLDRMREYCSLNELDLNTVESQLSYLMHELEKAYPGLFGLLCSCPNSAPGAAQAARDFCLYYEAPADPEAASLNRELIAEKLLYPTLIRN